MTECPCDREKTIDPWCAAAGMCARLEEEPADDRVVACAACGTEGQLISWSGSMDQYGNPVEHATPCPYCEGTGGEVIKTQPIDMEEAGNA